MNAIPWRNKSGKPQLEEDSPLSALRGEVDRLIDRLMPESLTSWSWPAAEKSASWNVPVDVAQSSEHVIVQAEVPGVPPESLEVTVSGNEMVISGHKQQSVQKAGEDWFQTERRFGAFRRTIRLPENVDSQKSLAEYRDGVLTVRVEKRTAAPPQRITVNAQATDPPQAREASSEPTEVEREEGQ